VSGKPVTKVKSALVFALAAAASSVIYLSFFAGLLGAAAFGIGLLAAPFAGLSAFAAYFIVARRFWSRISNWQLRGTLFGIAVVFMAHLLLGVPVYLELGEEERELSVGLWMFLATSIVTLPFGITAALALEARQRSVNSADD
jgi:hypothetical protein